MQPKLNQPPRNESDDISEVRSVRELHQPASLAASPVKPSRHSGRVILPPAPARAVREPVVALPSSPIYSLVDPLQGDTLSTSKQRKSERPSAFDSIAFVEGPRVLTITWLPPSA